MPNVAELITGHVTLTVDCVDRLYLNAYAPRLQSEGGVVAFLQHRGHPLRSPVLFGQITEAFKTRLRAWAARQGIPWVEFQKGERKEEVVQRYRDRFTGRAGVVCVGVAQEKAKAWTATKQVRGRRIHFAYRWNTVCVNHYYLYVLDPEWGPAFPKICGYAPYAMKCRLNGHEWAKRQARRRRLAYTALDNGFRTCADPATLQALCDALSAADLQAFFERWSTRVPLPLTPQDQAAGFGYRLSLLQMEVSRTQVYDRPLRGREFFEEVLRDNLDLGRPDRLQLLFDRKITRATPSRFSTRVITHGVAPSLHLEYKRCRIKQYFKEGRALRTETTVNDTYDFGVGRGLSNFAYLRTLGQRINARLLHAERTAHDCGLGEAQFATLVLPGRTPDGQPAPGLKFGQPRVMALLAALCLFGLTPEGITNRRLRPRVVELLGVPEADYTPRQMGYDLRRLARKGLLQRVEGKLCYTLTPLGRRTALFLTKLYARVLRPGFQALDQRATSQAPPPLRVALTAVDAATDRLLRDARLAAQCLGTFVQTMTLQDSY
ncbi:MAG: hypothetical protein HY613_00805 [Candidatus Rokubacteria bacterium]|nr:hypothetical protein [Candidatus Rokubacteria bacterium]